MIPKECKRLAEVDFPIAVVSKHSAREKSIRHGHPSTLHLWWARRPLAACRSMLLALLLPDPCDEHCPKEFKDQARTLLTQLVREIGNTDIDLRQALLKFIGDFANWDLSADRTYLDISRGLIKAAHPEETPLVVDPFAGGGSIPLEALRLGCETFASDLNPVACLILKVMLEDIPRHGPELAAELRRVGGEIKQQAEKELAEFYPKDPDGATPIAYLWARTVKCESPNCGAEISLLRSFWLCTKANRKRALRYEIVKGMPSRVEFEVFEPRSEKEVPGATVSRAKATCLCCGTVLPPERVRAQLAEQRGGADVVFDSKGNRTGGARLLVVITLRPGESGRHYRLPVDKDYNTVWKAKRLLNQIVDRWEKAGRQGLCPVPGEPLDVRSIRNIWVMTYGLSCWSDVFTARQLLSLLTLADGIVVASRQHKHLAALFACAFSIFARSCNAHARMRPDSSVAPAFGRHALPMTWTFPETVISGGRSEHFDGAINTVANALRGPGVVPGRVAQVQQADAACSRLPSESSAIWFTDPPYYDAVAYAYLSDFFYVWLRRTLREQEHPFLREPVVPKDAEIIVDRPHRLSSSTKNAQFYETGMGRAFAEGRRVVREDGVGSVVFAHKTTEGWEALLSGMIRGGLTITGSWPIATEKVSRLNARETASLATSVHLIFRPRPEDAPVGDWGDVLRELPKRVGDWMERLQSEGVRGADLVFACIGPALEIYSRYSKVVDPQEREIPLGGDPEATEPFQRGYLAYVWETVGRIALQNILGTEEARARNGMAGVLEEDARLTALFLWTLQSTNGNGEGTSEKVKGKSEKLEEEEGKELDEDEEGDSPKGKAKGYSLVFDVVRRFAQPLGIELPKWEGRIIETKKGVVRLMAVSERGKQIFGEDGADVVADLIEHDPRKDYQQLLFPELEEERAPKIRGRKRGKIARDLPSESAAQTGATTLDRVHAVMLLQAGGQANALRMLIKAEQDRGPDFLRLANALSALYPTGSEEKRLLDAMLLAVPR